MTILDNLKVFSKNLPKLPGVYKFSNRAKQVIYVGKAKSLRNRVMSYFNASSNHQQFKNQLLVREIRQIDYVVVNSEMEALLLENNFIKTHQPKYNILLKDDKSYPYIHLTAEPYPRLSITRKIEQGGHFFGPYTNIKLVNETLELVKKLYQIRSCSFNLNTETVARKKYPLCLEYHIKNCKGPCQGLQSQADYEADIKQISALLKGKIGAIKDLFRKAMYEASAKLNFEKAQIYKAKIQKLNLFQEKSLVCNPNLPDLEVYAIIANEKEAYINVLKVVQGAMTFSKNIEIKKKLAESKADLLSLALINTRDKFKNPAAIVLTNITLDIKIEGVEFKVPKIGQLKKLVELSLKNVNFFIKNRLLKKEQASHNLKRKRSLMQLKADLNLESLPAHIECFDNSNLQGTEPVAALVCFKNGSPAKKEYRHYNIKTVTGIDDFASMEEVVFRRYKRLLDEEKALPDLIIIDGGKGQLSAACKALKTLNLTIPIIGIAKRLEEIFRPNDKTPLLLNKQSASLVLIQRLRNEAHRFAITFHRQKRSRASKQSSRLIDIEGIGEKTVQLLYQHYQSFEKIKQAPKTKLNRLIGEARAAKVRAYLDRLDR